MTCFNLALTLFLAFEYDKAIFYLEKILDLFRAMQIEGLKYHSKFKIYSLLGVNYLKAGKLDKAHENMLKIRLSGSNNLTKEGGDSFELFFYKFFRALYYKKKSNFQKSEQHFKQALKFLRQIKSADEYMLPRFYYEFGLMYKNLNKQKKAKINFNKGLKYCEKLNYSFYKNLILTEVNEVNKFYLQRFQFEDSKFDFKWIAESAKLEETLKKLYKQIDKIKFLNNLQNLLVEASEKKELIDGMMDLIDHNFLAEESYFLLKEKGEWSNYFSRDYFSGENNNLNSETEIRSLIDLIASDAKEKVVYNTKENRDYKKIIGDFSSILFVPLKMKKRSVVDYYV